MIFAGLSAGMLYSSAQELQTMLQLKEGIASDKSEIADLKQQVTDLSDEKEKLEDPEYLKYMVRGKYLVSKDGEQVFKLPSSDRQRTACALQTSAAPPAEDPEGDRRPPGNAHETSAPGRPGACPWH